METISTVMSRALEFPNPDLVSAVVREHNIREPSLFGTVSITSTQCNPEESEVEFLASTIVNATSPELLSDFINDERCGEIQKLAEKFRGCVMENNYEFESTAEAMPNPKHRKPVHGNPESREGDILFDGNLQVKQAVQNYDLTVTVMQRRYSSGFSDSLFSISEDPNEFQDSSERNVHKDVRKYLLGMPANSISASEIRNASKPEIEKQQDIAVRQSSMALQVSSRVLRNGSNRNPLILSLSRKAATELPPAGFFSQVLGSKESGRRHILHPGLKLWKRCFYLIRKYEKSRPNLMPARR